ncbi:putative proximal tail fiber protein [uncultured Mediterranean phage]|nr:putative proximal tail fiber protein [uncultured Mediterranean phage]
MGTKKDFVVKKGLVVTEDIELGHATDTTIARSSAGVITVEGVVVPTISSTNTLTNKTLTTPVINIGSDAEGDIYYRTSGGAFTRLARGSDNQTMMMNGNVPNWETVASGGASALNGLTDVISNITDFTDSILISPDGAAPPHGILDAATDNVGIGKDVFNALTSGDNNVAIGSYAGDALTAGQANTFIGRDAGSAATEAGYSVAVGYQALQQHNASNNIAMGYRAMYNAGTGTTNTAIGVNCMTAAVTGSHNIGIGNSATQNLTSGEYNIGIGTNAQMMQTTGDRNISLGYQTIRGYPNGAVYSDNMAIGHQSMYGDGSSTSAGVSGADNLGLGNYTLGMLTSGNRNIAIGKNAGDGIDDESDNLAIGIAALGGSVAGGEKNVAIGNYSLDAVTSGDDNVSIGYNAGTTLTTGHSNVAIGAYALENADVGSHNVAIGYEAMECAADADVDDNVAIGTAALKAATDGTSGNVAIGKYALTLATKDDNVAIGLNAANSITTGERNVFIGTEAGHALEDDNNSVIIGHQAGDNLTAGNGNVIIGCYTNAPSTTNDGQLVIGTSVGVNDPFNWITGDSNGNVSLNHLADVVNITTGTNSLTQAQSGSYVYWTGGSLKLPADAAIGSQFTIFNNTGSSATVGLGSGDAMAGSWATNAAVADNEATSYVCVNISGSESQWVQVG